MLTLGHLRGRLRLAPVSFVFPGGNHAVFNYNHLRLYHAGVVLRQTSLHLFSFPGQVSRARWAPEVPLFKALLFAAFSHVVCSADSLSLVTQCSYQHLHFINMEIATQVKIIFWLLHPAFFPVDLELWFLIRDILLPRGYLTMSGDVFGCHTWAWQPASSWKRPGMPLNRLQSTGQPPIMSALSNLKCQ